ncbi:phosphoribosylanthranilate isomerase [Tomitella biformata]|uniref:phosphoribosylanthranilate isomerase n=1 Tax=Tomitella biformata TaxID=630403 RepID=UPI0004B1EAC4|nr:phosphoribosylanthranilate isomerase [Tomitella biformata]
MGVDGAMRVKVCGIRSAEDLMIVLEAGVDDIGFICGTTHFSEDSLTPDEASRLVALAPADASTVLVTHLVDPAQILALADHIGVRGIQLHGPVDDAAAASVRAGAFGRRVTRALHVVAGMGLAEISSLGRTADALLLDSRTAERLGGTGQVHDWSISARIRELAGAPVILAGGLTPENVAEAIAVVRPAGVDANSGLEDVRGDKDAGRVREFVERARAARAS